MKTLIACVALLSFAVIAEPPTMPNEIYKGTKEVNCAAIDLIFKTITGDEFKETPFWVGSEAKSADRFALFVNNKTHTWSIVQFSPTQACILGSGENFVFSEESGAFVLPVIPGGPTKPVKPAKPIKPSIPTIPFPYQSGKTA